MTQNVCPILLAAGQAHRFGSDKLLYPLLINEQTKPLIFHTLAPWLDVFSEINLVIRSDNKALFETLQQCEFSSRLRLISAEEPHEGMSASLISGVKATKQADAWLIGLADMPFIHKKVISESLKILRNGASITQPEFAGCQGHPVGFSSKFLPRLLALRGDKGAREILNESSELITLVTSPDDGILLDIDTKSATDPQSLRAITKV